MLLLLFAVVFVFGWYFGDLSSHENVKVLKNEIEILRSDVKYWIGKSKY